MDSDYSNLNNSPTWLYVMFIHDFNEDDTIVFKTIVDDLQKQSCTALIKVILIKNSLVLKRKLASDERYLFGGTKDYLYFCQTAVYESEIFSGQIVIKPATTQLFNYWQEAFDFVFDNYKANNYVLHTSSHSNGIEINSTDDGFVLNGCGNRKSSPVHQSPNFKKYLKKVIETRHNKPFLKGFKRPVILKKNGQRKLKKHSFKKWAVFNSTNGLLLYDLGVYLQKKKVKFNFLFLQNCDAFLLENVYHLRHCADSIIGTTGFIEILLKVHEVIYLSLLESVNATETQKNLIKNLKFLMSKTLDPKKNLLFAETKNIDAIVESVKKIMLSLNKLYLENEDYKKVRKPRLVSIPGLEISPISQYSFLQYYDTIDLLKEFASDNVGANKLINDLEGLFKENIIPLHSSVNRRYPTMLYPYVHRYEFLSHIRNLFRIPFNSFNQKSHYSNLLATLFFE